MKKEITETTLRGLIGAIPYAGTLLNEIIFEHCYIIINILFFIVFYFTYRLERYI